MPESTHTTEDGEKLTQTLLHVVAPYIDGLPTALVIEAAAAAFMAILNAGTGADEKARGLILSRYIDRLTIIQRRTEKGHLDA